MKQVARGLAFALVAGDWELAALRERAQSALGQRPRWLTPLLRRVLARFPKPPADPEEIVEFLLDDDRLRTAVAKAPRRVRIRRWFAPGPTMIPVEGPPARFGVTAIATEADLADFVGVTPGELDWFADTRDLNSRATDPRLRHYRYRWLEKRSGAGYRLLEAPKRRLKEIQRRLLRDVLAAIPPSDQAHGFVEGRSVRGFVEPHVARRVVVRLDLQDFFSMVTHAKVAAIFRRVGYPRRVAWLLAALCTARTPEDVLRRHPTRGQDLSRRFQTVARLRTAHLPQGAPTSPALSNLAALGLDRRLAGLARASAASYTRYADDMVFSGGADLSRSAARFVHLVGGIVLDEGFEVNYRKTRVMRSGRRQQVGGLVVNRRPNVERSEYDALRATLYNAARFGPDSQNRDGIRAFRAHLEGRVAWVAATNSSRGRRLARLLDAIEW